MSAAFLALRPFAGFDLAARPSPALGTFKVAYSCVDVASMWFRARLVADIVSMKVFVWVLGGLFTRAVDSQGGVLDSHLFFFDRYSDLAEYHRSRGRVAKPERLAAIAEAYYRAAPDDDPPGAAAMAMPVPRPRVSTNAVSTARMPEPRADGLSDLAPFSA